MVSKNKCQGLEKMEAGGLDKLLICTCPRGGFEDNGLHRRISVDWPKLLHQQQRLPGPASGL